MLPIFWISMSAAAIFGLYCFFKVLLCAPLSSSEIAVAVLIDDIEAVYRVEALWQEAVAAPIALKSRRSIILITCSTAEALSLEQRSCLQALAQNTGAEIFTVFDFNANTYVDIKEGEK